MKAHEDGKRKLRSLFASMTLMVIFMFISNGIKAHCDTMDGPVVKDARTAMENNNVNYVLKWVQPQSEAEAGEAFELAMKVSKLGTDAKKLAEQYFFETIVRLHRTGEGVSYTGLKPSGTPIDKRILAADIAIERGSLEPLKGLVSGERHEELAERFRRVMALKEYDKLNVEAGREYVEAYVSFFKFAEGEEEHKLNEQHVH